MWDTVGSFGLPEEISMSSKIKGCPFGFPDRILGEHIERAYQALALNETRADFVSFFFNFYIDLEVVLCATQLSYHQVCRFVINLNKRRLESVTTKY